MKMLEFYGHERFSTVRLFHGDNEYSTGIIDAAFVMSNFRNDDAIELSQMLLGDCRHTTSEGEHEFITRIT